VLWFVAGKRLALGRLTVVDATNVQVESRKPWVELALQHHCLPVALSIQGGELYANGVSIANNLASSGNGGAVGVGGSAAQVETSWAEASPGST
jgi:hypothetical protein